jgi:hypothetical protein
MVYLYSTNFRLKSAHQRIIFYYQKKVLHLGGKNVGFVLTSQTQYVALNANDMDI